MSWITLYLLLPHNPDFQYVHTFQHKAQRAASEVLSLILETIWNEGNWKPLHKLKAEVFCQPRIYSYGYSTPFILQRQILSGCYELMGWDKRSKAALHINHSSVLRWERRQEITLKHYNCMATHFNCMQTEEKGFFFSFFCELQKCFSSRLETNKIILKVRDFMVSNKIWIVDLMPAPAHTHTGFLDLSVLLSHHLFICNLPVQRLPLLFTLT